MKGLSHCLLTGLPVRWVTKGAGKPSLNTPSPNQATMAARTKEPSRELADNIKDNLVINARTQEVSEFAAADSAAVCDH